MDVNLRLYKRLELFEDKSVTIINISLKYWMEIVIVTINFNNVMIMSQNLF